MSDLKTTQEKMSSLGASMASNVSDVLQEARPAMDRVSHRVKDEWQQMGKSGQDAASDVKHTIEKEARHMRAATENFIHHQPLNAVLLAAGTGAAVALAVSWLKRSRQA